jgi:hypothetical protein
MSAVSAGLGGAILPMGKLPDVEDRRLAGIERILA